jgi:hypothetical protein
VLGEDSRTCWTGGLGWEDNRGWRWARLSVSRKPVSPRSTIHLYCVTRFSSVLRTRMWGLDNLLCKLFFLSSTTTHCLYAETCTKNLKQKIYSSSDCILTTCIMWFNSVAALSSAEDITTMTWADSLDHQRQPTCDFFRFSIQRLRLSKQHLGLV